MKLTDEQAAQVEALAAYLSQDQIADYLGISRTTLSAIIARDDNVSVRYKRGKARALEQVARSLVQDAIDGDTTSRIFYLKTQGGWRETNHVDHTSSDGSMTPKGVSDDLAAALDAIADKITGSDGAS